MIQNMWKLLEAGAAVAVRGGAADFEFVCFHITFYPASYTMGIRDSFAEGEAAAS
jgi:hypothetical protein